MTNEVLEKVIPKIVSSNDGQFTFEYSSFSSSNCEESESEKESNEEDDNDKENPIEKDGSIKELCLLRRRRSLIDN